MPDELSDKMAVSPKRDAIVSAAAELFLDRGFGTVSMDTIAAKAGVSKRTVYSHFESKENLFQGIMSDICACSAFADRQFEEDSGVPLEPPEIVLTQLGMAFMGILGCAEGSALYRVVMAEGVNFPELVRTFYEFGPESLSRKLAAYLEDQTKKGVLKVEDTRQAAYQFIGMLTTPIMLEITIGIRGPVSEKELADIVDGSVTMFLQAFKA